ncbi:MAG: hypothetical protein ABMB14_11815 [Myxococcota bacterium]
MTIELPSARALRKPRAATLALKRASQAGLRALPGDEAGVTGTLVPGINPESRHAKNGSHGQPSGIAPSAIESRHGIAPRRTDPWAEPLKRSLATLDRARRMRAWIEAESGRKNVDVARKEGVTRARVSQLLLLLKLVPEIPEDLGRPGRTGKVPTEVELRQFAVLDPAEQLGRYCQFLGIGGPVRAVKLERNRGLERHLARARELRALIDSGRFESIADLARHAGMSGSRASQLLNLLELHPEILAAIEHGEAAGVSEPELRKIARMRDKPDQLREWRHPSR